MGGMCMDILEIEKLVVRAKQNDIEAYELLYCTFTPFIVIWCSRLHIPNYTFEDLKQECYLYLVHAVEKYRGTTTFVSYATQTIKNNLCYLLREQVKESKATFHVPLESVTYVNEATMPNIENFVIKNIQNSIIEAAINSLSSMEQRIIKDYYFNSLNLKEISMNLDLKYITTVKKKDKALLKLNKIIENDL